MAKDIMQAMRGRKEELPQLLPGQFGFCVDTDEVFIGNGDGNANIQMGAKGEKGEQGDKGEVFTPAISEEGILSWTNEGGLPNPPDLDLKEIPLKSITADKLSEELFEQINNLLSCAVEFRKEIDILNSIFPNDLLSNIISSLKIEVNLICRAGHSEYDFYEIKCTECTLKNGGKVFNKEGEYIRLGNGSVSVILSPIGVNPNQSILIPLTGKALNDCLYIGEEQDDYLFLDIHSGYWYDIRDNEGMVDGVSYAKYDRITLDLTLE